ncbi:MAG: hypothetical protein U5L72_07450 [Bacteroidales bacterium]|nr:hypothetical protein [Bacteroidales bacterium]
MKRSISRSGDSGIGDDLIMAITSSNPVACNDQPFKLCLSPLLRLMIVALRNYDIMPVLNETVNSA